MLNSLLRNCKIVKVLDSQADGQATNNTDIVDTQGFEGVCFITKLGAVTNAGAITMTIQQDTDSAGGTMAALSGAQAAIASTSSDAEQSLVVDVFRPRERYARASIVRATQNSEIDAVYAILYGATALPVTQPATIDASAFVVSPAEA